MQKQTESNTMNLIIMDTLIIGFLNHKVVDLGSATAAIQVTKKPETT